MFGHDDKQSPNTPMPADLADDGTLGTPMQSNDTALDTAMAMSDTPVTDDAATAAVVADLGTSPSSVVGDDGMPPFEATTAPGDTTPAPARMDANTPDDLIAIKQDALQSLKPLVGHLDQTPEEKFRTTMMMIQAADDQSLIPAAFEAAKAISDDKSRAQALLDVINEINYFTSQASAK